MLFEREREADGTKEKAEAEDSSAQAIKNKALIRAMIQSEYYAINLQAYDLNLDNLYGLLFY